MVFIETEEAQDLAEKDAEDTRTRSCLVLRNMLMTNVGPSLDLCRRRAASVNIYVGNLPFDVTEEELQQEFVAFGQVTSVVIMNDRYIGSGQPREYGFVEMSSKSQGQAAIEALNGKTFKNRVIEVVEALPLSKTTRDNPGDHRRDRRSSGRPRYGGGAD